MKKLTAKQLTVLKASQVGTLYACKTSFRSSRDYKFVIDFEAGDFNKQTDRLLEMGYVMIGKPVDGNWGPRNVWITEAGQKALKNS